MVEVKIFKSSTKHARTINDMTGCLHNLFEHGYISTNYIHIPYFVLRHLPVLIYNVGFWR
jgi:hypothetical protein